MGIQNFVNKKRSILDGISEIKKLFYRRGIKEKETQIGIL